jgi:hypothetical protein
MVGQATSVPSIPEANGLPISSVPPRRTVLTSRSPFLGLAPFVLPATAALGRPANAIPSNVRGDGSLRLPIRRCRGPFLIMYENIQFPDTTPREARALRAQLSGDDNAFVLDSGHGLAVIPSPPAEAGSGTLYQVTGPETRSAAVVSSTINPPSVRTADQERHQNHAQ